jgi:hypothetical protein
MTNAVYATEITLAVVVVLIHQHVTTIRMLSLMTVLVHKMICVESVEAMILHAVDA